MYRQWCWCGQSYLFHKGLLCVPQLLWFGQVQNKNHWHITSEWIMKETTRGHSAWTTHAGSFSWPDVVCCHWHFNQFGEKGATTKFPEMGHILCLYRRAIHSICWCGQHLALNEFRGENRGKWKGWQPLRVEPRTPLAWAASDLPLSNDSQTTTNPHNPSICPGGSDGTYGVAAIEAFSTTCAGHIEDCEGWWLSGCRGSAWGKMLWAFEV